MNVLPSEISAPVALFTSETPTLRSQKSGENPEPLTTIWPPTGTVHGAGVAAVPQVNVTVGAVWALMGAIGPTNVWKTKANPNSRRSGAERRAIILCISCAWGPRKARPY
jgi:hypothetical protein